jgi:hypothetical protein
MVSAIQKILLPTHGQDPISFSCHGIAKVGPRLQALHKERGVFWVAQDNPFQFVVRKD